MHRFFDFNRAPVYLQAYDPPSGSLTNPTGGSGLGVSTKRCIDYDRGDDHKKPGVTFYCDKCPDPQNILARLQRSGKITNLKVKNVPGIHTTFSLTGYSSVGGTTSTTSVPHVAYSFTLDDIYNIENMMLRADRGYNYEGPAPDANHVLTSDEALALVRTYGSTVALVPSLPDASGEKLSFGQESLDFLPLVEETDSSTAGVKRFVHMEYLCNSDNLKIHVTDGIGEIKKGKAVSSDMITELFDIIVKKHLGDTAIPDEKRFWADYATLASKGTAMH